MPKSTSKEQTVRLIRPMPPTGGPHIVSHALIVTLSDVRKNEASTRSEIPRSISKKRGCHFTTTSRYAVNHAEMRPELKVASSFPPSMRHEGVIAKYTPPLIERLLVTG